MMKGYSPLYKGSQAAYGGLLQSLM